MSIEVAAIIATRNRPKLLEHRSVPSVLRQTRRPDLLVVVDDGEMPTRTRASLARMAASVGISLVILTNQRTRGAGGAWNTGLAYLASVGYRGFVAILDDDDCWDADHLETNLAFSEGATIVVSGLRIVRSGRIIERPLLTHLHWREFLVGNPGWQGSNTFVRLDALIDVGGFREGLPSLNDRDLAIRLLRRPGVRWRTTGRWTATWHLDTPDSLSVPGSRAKRDGLRGFWALYGSEMRPDERRQFFERAWRLFRISREDIVGADTTAPALGFPRGCPDAA